MLEGVQQLAKRHRLLLCIECGKCVAVCPMGLAPSYPSPRPTPRGIVAQALAGLAAGDQGGLWHCLTCDLCTRLCPVGVRLREFVEAVHELARAQGCIRFGAFCRGCGSYLGPGWIVDYVVRNLGETSDSYARLCVRCRQYSLGNRVKALTPGNRRVPTQKAPQRNGP